MHELRTHTAKVSHKINVKRRKGNVTSNFLVLDWTNPGRHETKMTSSFTTNDKFDSSTKGKRHVPSKKFIMFEN